MLRKYLQRKRLLVTSALARAEVARALLPWGSAAVDQGEKVMRRLEIIRINDRILYRAGRLPPIGLRSLDAIHLATAGELAEDLARVCTYDDRIAAAAATSGFTVVAPRLTLRRKSSIPGR